MAAPARFPRWSVLLCATLGSLACTELGRVCDASIQPSIVVEIRDSLTDAPVGTGAFGLVVDGSFADTLTPYGIIPPDTVVSLGMRGERVGTYQVEIRQTGYLTWQQNGVKVTGAACHSSQVHLLARLVLEP